MYPARLFTTSDEVVGGRAVKRRVSPVIQVALRETGLLKERPYRTDVLGLTVVRAAGDGEFPVIEPKGVGSPGEDERQGLKRLQGRARIAVSICVSGG